MSAPKLEIIENKLCVTGISTVDGAEAIVPISLEGMSELLNNRVVFADTFAGRVFTALDRDGRMLAATLP